ncbi:MAG: F0F1 ATP synthase subunit A [Phycisphaerae bacterium]
MMNVLTQLPLAANTEELLLHVLPHHFNSIRIGNWPLNSHVIMMLIAALLVFLLFSYVGAQAKKNTVPTGVHNFAEAMLSFLRTDLIRPALGENADKFTPFIWTVFFFILFCNLLGMIPGSEIVELLTHGRLQHVWGTATGNLMVTAGLAIVAFVMIHVAGITQAIRIKMDPSLAPHHHGSDHAQPHGHGEMHGMEGIEDERDVVYDHHVGDGHDHAHGVHHSQEFHGQPFPVAFFTGIGHYIWNFAPHPEIGWKPLDILMWVFLLGLEAVGALIKPFSLCIRLFANMLAGHLVLASLVGMILLASNIAARGSISVVVIAGCTALSLLELFVAFLQAYIFTFLTTLFIASAVAPEH